MVMPVKKQPWYKRLRLSEIIPGNSPAEEPNQDVKRLIIKTEAVGSPGTQIYAGYISEEYLQSLQGYARADIMDQMRRSDAQIGMCLSAVKNPILSASRNFEPASDQPDQAMHAEFMEHLFNDMEDSFDQFLTEALTCPEFGYALFEMTDKVVTDHPKWGTYNGIKQLGWRSPRTIHRFNVDPKTAKLVSVTQYAYGDLQKTVDIPAEYLLLMTIQREGANFEGISLLRRCYGNWFRKDHYLKMNAIGIEKFAIPTPIVDIPDGAQGSDQYTNLIEALEVYTTHQSNYLTKPKGWDMNFADGVYDPAKVEASIDAEDTRMTKAFLANFLQLGMSGGGGAYALSNDLSDFFLGGIKYIANLIAASVNQVVIPRMIKMNFGEQLAYPQLKFSGIDDKIGQEFGVMMKALADSQYITPDDQLEESIRKRLTLPKMSKIGQRAVKSIGALGIPGAANPPDNPPVTLAERIRKFHKDKRG